MKTIERADQSALAGFDTDSDLVQRASELPDRQSKNAILEFTAIPVGVASPQILQVPPGLWKVRGLHFRVVTDATVANRTPFILLGALLAAVASVAQTASLTVDWFLSMGGQSQTTLVNNATVIPGPDEILLKGGDFVTVFTTVPGAADVISQLELRLERMNDKSQPLQV